MKFDCRTLPYKQTHFFSKFVIDYIDESQQLQDFYTYQPNLQGIKQAIENKQKNYTNRDTLVRYFEQQYAQSNPTTIQLQNIALLKKSNCFTVTTAHQPNIFIGPLYFIYKILHAIKMANDLSEQLPEFKFVPAYYMGSEDADLEELGNITIQQKKLVWQTQQTGAVGRMKVDANFITLINAIEAQIAVNNFGKELVDIFKNCYKLNDTIQHSTFNLVNTLFGKYGLLVVIPDNVELKKTFIPVVEKELREQFSEKEVIKTVEAINANYKIKQTGRNLNLFYLIDDKRERIEFESNVFIIEKLGLKFTLDEILNELNNHPERFSANVILRPVFQETILPNIAFIGGGGEVTYWLQLKNVFEKAGVNFPPIILRNSFLLYKKQQEIKLQKMNLKVEDLFTDTETLFSNWVKQQSNASFELVDEKEIIKNLYDALAAKATQIDATLQRHVKASSIKTLKQIENIERKILRAEKRKFTDQKNQLKNIKEDLFYNNSLQERTENFSYLYSIYGSELFNVILNCSKSFDQKFTMISIEQ